MDREQIEKFISISTRVLVTILVFITVFLIVDLEANKNPPEVTAKKIQEMKKMMAIIQKGGKNLNKNLPDEWPPRMNNPYPELELIDQEGKEFFLSDLKGKVIIMEYVDISLPKSQAQSGAALAGPYYGGDPEDIDKSIELFSEILRKNTETKMTLPNPNVIHLKVIIYGEAGAQASRDDAQGWAEHFNLRKTDNVIVAVPKKDMRSDETQGIITGYQLIDKNMILRVDSAGTLPKHNLQLTFVPLVPKLIRQ